MKTIIQSFQHNFTELELNLPLIERSSNKSEEPREETPFDNRFMQVQAEQEEMERQQACLNAWTTLQDDLHQLQQLFIDFNNIVHVSLGVFFHLKLPILDKKSK